MTANEIRKRLQACPLGVMLLVSGVAAAQQALIVADDGTNANAFRSQPGRVVTFVCPSSQTRQREIWGTDTYLYESPVCTAAVHAGVLAPGVSGQVTIRIGTGTEALQGTLRNGVTSGAYARPDTVYGFIANSEPGQIDWHTTFARVPDDFTSPVTVRCPANGATDSVVIGTDLYRSDSAVCVAAVHAGLITPDAGGVVTVRFRPKQQSLVASDRNGVSSRAWTAGDYLSFPQPYAVELPAVLLAAPGFATAVLSSNSAQASTAAVQNFGGLVVTTDAQGRATLSWDPVPGAMSYVAIRWNVSDLACCNKVSPPGAITGTSWLDGALPQAATYAYRLYAATPTGTMVSETRVNYANGVVRPLGELGAAGSGTIASVAAPPTVAIATRAADAGPLQAEPTAATAEQGPFEPPPRRSPSAPATGVVVQEGVVRGVPNCLAVQNIQARATSPNSARITWDPPITPCQINAATPVAIAGWYVVLRSPGTDGRACPATDPDVAAFEEGTVWYQYVSPQYPGCVLSPIDPQFQSDFEDFTLESGATYVYRIFPMYQYSCGPNEFSCFALDDYPGPPSQAAVTTPLGPAPQDYFVNPPDVLLKVTVTGGWDSDIDVDMTFSWNPVQQASAYVLAWDVTVFSGQTFAAGSITVPASPTPSYSNTFYLDYGETLRTCISIVTDPNAPPDPRTRGQCVWTRMVGSLFPDYQGPAPP